MCFTKTPTQPLIRPYAPDAPPPYAKKAEVPDWMVSQVIEQRQKRRLAGYTRTQRVPGSEATYDSVISEAQTGFTRLGGS